MLRQLGQAFKENVPDTPELRRIMRLPRRIWETEIIEGVGGVGELAQMLTNFICAPGGTQTLRPVQAKALQDAHDTGGLFGPIPVGDGKTLISFLAPVLMQAKRPLLVIPARLRGKTEKEFSELAQHWKRHPDLAMVNYEKLSREGGMLFLEDRNPDLLVLDEAHRVKNREAAVTRKINEWVRGHPTTCVLAMSGTITKRSLLDFAHIICWCLPLELRPLPAGPKELEAWAAAVDVIKFHENRTPGNPGALKLFLNEDEKKRDRDGVRSGVRRRIQETPGVVSSKGQDVEASLNIILSLVGGYNQRIKDLAWGLLEGVKPNGDIITDKDLATKWRVTRTLTSGFWYRWSPSPPSEWLEHRSTWKKFVRGVLRSNTKGFESEALVTRAVVAKNLIFKGAFQKYENWLAVKNTYKINVIPVWEDDRMIQAVAQWAKGRIGIIWVSEIALGERLEEKLGFSYFHQMGLDKRRRPIESVTPEGCIVASVSANSEGRNLQAWNDNLVISPPPTGTVWEQVLGRTHRPGQEADEVWFEVLIGCNVEWECWKQALVDANYGTNIEAPKKLMYATIDRTFDPPEGSGPLWPTQYQEEEYYEHI